MRLPVLTLLALAACGARDESASTSSAVVGGFWDQSTGPTVGIFRCSGTCAFTPYLNAEEICSGTLIAPNLVLTARHCVAPQLNSDSGVLCSVSTFGPTYPADNFIVTPAKDTFEGGPWYVAREVAVDGKDGDLVCGNDVAILELRQSYLGATPMAPRLTSPPVEKEVYSAIGYGDDQDGGLGYRHRRDNLKIQCVGTACKLLGLDKLPIVQADELEGQTGLCGGDSGGPAVDVNGLLIGVTSRADSTSCTLPVYSRVDSHGAWLQAQAARAASAGNYPLPSWAYEPLPSDAGADASFDASAFDASHGQDASSSQPPPEAQGGCSASGGSADASWLLVLLLRFARRGSKSSS